MKLLLEKGAEVNYRDPYAPEFSHFETHWRSVKDLNSGLVKGMDCVVILTDHSLYDWELVAKSANLVFVSRIVTNGISSKKSINYEEQRCLSF